MMDSSTQWSYPRHQTILGEISVRLHTYENVYAMHPDHLSRIQEDGRDVLESSRLAWDRGQQETEGHLSVAVTLTPGRGIRISAIGVHSEGVKSLVVTLHGVPRGDITNVPEGRLSIPEDGCTISYPGGWPDHASAHLGIEVTESLLLSIRSEDDQIRSKTFVMIPHVSDPGMMDVDLLLESDPTDSSTSLTIPEWVVVVLNRTSPDSEKA
ncbi:MAG: hypothetical protein LBG99_07830 [Propionibacteriaceae bacterium]|nr:hypothetical protein [Propionibacteriaceae bacterium]